MLNANPASPRVPWWSRWFRCSCRRRPTAQAAITGVVRDASGGVLPGVTVEAASPVLIEKVRSVVTDDQRPVPHRRSAARHLLGDVLAARLQHRQARRHRAVGELRRHGERRPEGRRARGNDHGDRRVADRRRAEHAVAADHRQGRPRRDSLLAERRRHPGDHSRHDHDRRFRRHQRDDAGRRRRHPRRARERLADLCGRHQHGVGRQQRRRRATCRRWPRRRKW